MEVNNVLRRFEKRGLITHDTTRETIGFVSSLPIKLDDGQIDFRMPQVVELACKHDLTIYDSFYLELALRHSLPLATMGNALCEAMKNEGLSLYL
jgi:predicted nucleic acid-binding protein